MSTRSPSPPHVELFLLPSSVWQEEVEGELGEKTLKGTSEEELWCLEVSRILERCGQQLRGGGGKKEGSGVEIWTEDHGNHLGGGVSSTCGT